MRRYIAILILTTVMFALSGVCLADDTEIYGGQQIDIPPNVLIIVDNSFSMNRDDVPVEYDDPDHDGFDQRIVVAKDTIKNLIDNTENVRFGLMVLNPYYEVEGDENERRDDIQGVRDEESDGGRIIAACKDWTGSKQALKNIVDGIQVRARTQLAEALAEAGLYFGRRESYFNYTDDDFETGRNNKIDYGDKTKNFNYVYRVDPNLSSDTIQEETVEYSEYAIQWRCQKNYVVYMTDGQPVLDYDEILYSKKYMPGVVVDGVAYPEGVIIGDYDNDIDAADPLKHDDEFHYMKYNEDEEKWEQIAYQSATNDGERTDYLDDVAYFLYRNDILNEGSDGYGDFSDPKWKQNIKTYTIGFTIHHPLLHETAKNGHGLYKTAFNSGALSEAFTSMLDDINERNAQFVAPTVPINRDNNIYASNSVYMGLFMPKESGQWMGNLKKFGIDSNGNLLDRDGAAAIDDQTGAVKETAHSCWSDIEDGIEVMEGGAGSFMTSTRGDFYTRIDSSLIAFNDTNITAAMLDLDNDADRDDLIDYIKAEGVYASGGTYERKWAMGDILHSQPAVLYDDEHDKNVIFVGANDGFLHCFVDDTKGTDSLTDDTVSEAWSFVPGDLLDKLKELPPQGAAEHIDGDDDHDIYVDGSPSVYSVGGDDYVMFGLRRGGSKYYTLDVTDYDNPSFAWDIPDDILHDGSEQESLGQSWSTPVFCKIETTSGGLNDVILLSGGYSTSQDEVQSNEFDHWEVTSGDATIDDPDLAEATITMGSSPSTVTAFYATKPDPPTTYTLTVVNGSGDGDYTSGAAAAIRADKAPSGRFFDSWVVNSGSPIIGNTNASETNLTMPTGDVTVTATYKGPDFEVDAGQDTDGDNRWEDLASENPSGMDFQLDNNPAVTRAADVSLLPGISAAYDFPGGETGNEGGALLSLAGTTDRKSTQDMSGDWSDEDVTIEIWFKPDDLSTDDTNGEILFETGGGTGFGFFMNDSLLQLRQAKGGKKGCISKDITAIKDEFIQAVGTYDVSAGNMELFVNGISVGTANPGESDWSGSDNAAIGTRGGSNTGGLGSGQQNTESFEGMIAIFRIYRDSILTADEVYANYSVVAGVEYTLTVNNGNGDGDYVYGDDVTITADVAPVGKVFSHWTIASGNPEIASINSVSTTLTMPSSDVTITAVYNNLVNTLTVIGGSGGGDYSSGEEVEIEADTDSGSSDTEGRAMFAVDAGDGSLVTDLNFNNANYDKMKYCIVDFASYNHNYYDCSEDSLDNLSTDVIYAPSLGGEIFVFYDREEAHAGGEDGKWEGRLLFEADADTLGSRKFFAAPSVVQMTADFNSEYIYIGSGNREDPDSGVANRFYAIKVNWPDLADWNDDDDCITDADLVDVTSGTLQDPDATDEEQSDVQNNLAAGKGWYFDLENSGEKVVGSPIVFNRNVYFATYTPTPASDDKCSSATTGDARLYVVDYVTGNSVRDFDKTNNTEDDIIKTKADRSKVIGKGIPSGPTAILTDGGIQILVGTDGGTFSGDGGGGGGGGGKKTNSPFFQINWQLQ